MRLRLQSDGGFVDKHERIGCDFDDDSGWHRGYNDVSRIELSRRRRCKLESSMELVACSDVRERSGPSCDTDDAAQSFAFARKWTVEDLNIEALPREEDGVGPAGTEMKRNVAKDVANDAPRCASVDFSF